MFVAFRKLAILLVVVVFLLVAAVLAYSNQNPIDVDIGLVLLEDVSLTVVLAVTFAMGAIFGGIVSAFTLLRHYRERRVLRRELRRAQTELANSRSLLLPDAD